MGSEKIQRHYWDRIYDQYARLYDAVDWLTFNTTHKYRLKIAPHLPEKGTLILEIGPGTGKFHRILAQDYQVAGLDLALGMARLTNQRLKADGLSSCLCQGDAYALPWPASTFDAIVLSFVLSAIPDIQQAMDEMLRVLRPDGKIIILDAGESKNGNYFAHLLAVIWELLGDFIRDEQDYLLMAGMCVKRYEMGPGGCVHIIVGEYPR